jgi:rhodanese-related sulfurtransferase/DNA-binding transcriptional ArsR family regulator
MSISVRDFKDSIYQQFSKIGKALSSPKRLELLELLSQGSKSVESLVLYTEMSIANVSQHLQVLSEARLVKVQRKGTYAYYELSDKSVAALVISMRNLCEMQIAEVQKIKENFLSQQGALEAIPIEKVIHQMNEGTVMLIDVRPRDEYDAGHIMGAVSIPIDQLNDQLVLFQTEKNVIAYCRGPYCVYAIQAVEILRSKGFSAVRLEAGVHEWNMYLDQTH